MKMWLRRLRGALGIGTLWGATGLVVGKVTGLVVSVWTGLPLLGTVVSFGVGAAGLGFALGTAFAVVLTTLERQRSADQLTPARAAMWGAIAGVGLALLVGVTGIPRLFPAISVQGLILLIGSAAASYGALTAGLAAGTVALAKRAPPELDGPADSFTALPSPRGR
jgi:hypothetical protein